MKHMIATLIVLSLGLSGCSSQKKLTEDPPFTVKDAMCQSWVGGREESGTGMEVSLSLDGLPETGLTLNQLFFRGRVGDISLSTAQGSTKVTCSFTDQKKDISMHSDPMKEVGNQPPRIKTDAEKDFPFELGQDEAVISYLVGDHIHYYKISGIVEKPGRAYLGREQQ